MNKLLKYIAYYFIFSVAVCIIGLGAVFLGPKITSHNYQKTSQKYQEACRNLDFETAREYLNDLHQDYISDKDQEAEENYFKAFDYIYKAEIQYILSEFDEDECVDKITFLMEEIPVDGDNPKWAEHYNRLCNSILKLSINRNYSKLAKVVLTLFIDNGADRDAAEQKYEEAVKAGLLKK